MISYDVNGFIYKLDFLKYVGNDEWRINFGLHQKELSENDSINNLIIGFDKCEYVEPLVLLSLGISVQNFISKGKKVTITLPENVEPYSSFLRYFVRSGFINIFKHENISIVCKVGNASIPYDINIEQDIMKIQDILQNVEGTLFPATVFEMNNKNFNDEVLINKQVSQIVDSINLKQYNINYNEQKRLKNNIFQILIETFENVKYHAYEKQKPQKLVGVFLRYRCNTYLHNLSRQQKDRIKEIRDIECKNTKLLANYTDANKGFIEVFIIDSGIGIIGSMSNNFPVEEIHYKSKFAGLFYKTFYEGNRKQTKRHKTTFGGLFMLNRVLKKNNDFIYAAENNTVIGTYSNINDGEYNKYVHRFVQNEISEDKIVSGLSMIFRLNINPTTSQVLVGERLLSKDLVLDAFKAKNKVGVSNSIFKDFRKFSFPLEFENINYNSIDNLFLMPFEKISKDNIINIIESYCIEYKFLVCFSDSKIKKSFFQYIQAEQESLFKTIKNHIDDTPKEIAEYIVNHKNIKNVCLKALNDFLEVNNINLNIANKNLVIVDVPLHSITIYTLAIKEAIQSNLSETIKLIDNIFVMTNCYEFFAFRKKGNKYISNTDIDTIKKDYTFYIQVLRYYDSLIFWRTLFKLQKESCIEYFLNANIEWGKDKTIKRYLNFENILQNETLTLILENALLRLRGIYPDENIEFIPTDKVVKKLLERVNVVSKMLSTDTTKQIKINSVYLTGLTFHNSINNVKTELTINIFAHPMRNLSSNDDFNNLPHNETCLLLWPNDKWSEQYIPSTDIDYFRVGQTHMISKDKNLKILHQNHEDYYECGLKETYLKFQTQYPPFIRFGHYNYKGNHELVNVNFNNIFDETTSMGAEIFNYVLCNIFFSLVDENVERKIEQCPLEYQNILLEFYQNKKSEKEERVEFVLYPSHYYTDNIMNKIKGIIPESETNKVIPMSFISHGNNMITISPDSINRFKSIIKCLDSKDGNVLFFDTMISSGQTRRIIKNYLLSTECLEAFSTKGIRNLIVIDARRMPYPTKQSEKNKYYMRMDIPRLGNNKSCVLCNTLNFTKEVLHKIKNTKYSERIKLWIDKWSESSVLELYEQKFLSDKPINKLSQKSDVDHPILNTTGLLVYSLESHSLYARDDIMNEIFDEYMDELNPQDVIMLICSKLLLFGNYDASNLQIEIIERLIKNLIRIDNYEDSIAYLGFITLLIQEPYCIEEAIFRIANENVDNYMFNNLSIDLKIIFSYFADVSKKLFLLLPYKITSIFDNFSRMKAYEFIHSLVCNDFGHLHDTELMKYVKKTPQTKTQLCRTVRHICALLGSALYVMKHIEQNEVNSTILFDSEEVLNDEIDQIKKGIIHMENEIDENVDFHSLWHSKEHINIVSTINDRYDYYCDIHSGLFIQGDGENSPTEHIYEELQAIIKETMEDLKCNDNPFKLISNKKLKVENNQKIWYFWNSEIRTEIKYLLGNVRKNSGMLDDDGTFMNISVEQSVENLKISLSNLSEHDDIYVRNKTINKQRRDMIKNKSLGVTIEYMSTPVEQGYMLQTLITIPSITTALKNYEN